MWNSWIKAYDNFDRLLWGAFEGIIHFAWYEGCLAVAFSGGARGRPVPGDYRICRRRGIGLW